MTELIFTSTGSTVRGGGACERCATGSECFGRSSAVSSLARYLHAEFSVDFSGFDKEVEAASAVPAMLDAGGRDLNKVLACLGDAELTAMIARLAVRHHFTGARYQEARSRVTSGPALAAVFVDSPLRQHIAKPGSVQWSAPAVGARAAEAVMGLVVVAAGPVVFEEVVTRLGFVSGALFDGTGFSHD